MWTEIIIARKKIDKKYSNSVKDYSSCNYMISQFISIFLYVYVLGRVGAYLRKRIYNKNLDMWQDSGLRFQLRFYIISLVATDGCRVLSVEWNHHNLTSFFPLSGAPHSLFVSRLNQLAMAKRDFTKVSINVRCPVQRHLPPYLHTLHTIPI